MQLFIQDEPILVSQVGRKPNTTLTCPSCKKSRDVYVRKSNPRKGYCSPECIADGQRHERKHTSCIGCGTELTKKWQKKFCTISCSATYYNARRIKLPPKPRPPRICKHVGCNNACVRPEWFCSDLCIHESKERKRRLQNEYRMRYRARKANQMPDDADEEGIKEFYMNCPAGYHVDHIMPLCKGGVHDLCNLQYLTPEENHKKSGNVPIELLISCLWLHSFL